MFAGFLCLTAYPDVKLPRKWTISDGGYSRKGNLVIPTITDQLMSIPYSDKQSFIQIPTICIHRQKVCRHGD